MKIIVNSSGIGIMEGGVFVKFEDQEKIWDIMFLAGLFLGRTFLGRFGEYDIPLGYEVVISCKAKGNLDSCGNETCWDLEQCQGNPNVAILKKVLEKLVKVKFLSKEESERRHHESIRKEFEEDVMYSGAGEDYATKGKQLADLLNSETKESMSEWLEMFKSKLKQEIEAEICSILNNQELTVTQRAFNKNDKIISKLNWVLTLIDKI